MERPRRSLFRWFLIGTVLFVLLVVFCVLIDLFTNQTVQIGPQTTFLTPARRTDGSLDFATALHERLSEGVTEKDNAAILLIRAFGPAAISPELQRQYFEWLKIEPLPEKGNYVVPQLQFIQEKRAAGGSVDADDDTLLKEFSKASQQPWLEQDHPLAAEWLQRNAEPLKLITEASHRTQYYSPIVSNADLLQGETTVHNLRETARLLVVRAMLRLGDDDIPGAWDDLLACHRLASLSSERSPNVIQLLVCVALDGMASKADEALIAHPLFAQNAKQCLADHRQLAPLSGLEDVIELGERICSLDAILHQLPPIGVDSNLMLRRMNVAYDQIVATFKIADYKGREAAMQAVAKERDAQAVAACKPLRWVPMMMFAPRRAITDTVGTTLMTLLFPAFEQANQARTRADARRDLVRIGFALAAFRAEKGAYPKALDELAGELDKVPPDRFTGQPYRYEPREKGFLIYSVGANGKDDGGVMRGPDQDDISLEVPPKLEE